MKQDSWQYSEEIDAVAAAEVVVSRVGSGGPCVLCAVNAEHSPDEEVRTVWWWWTRGMGFLGFGLLVLASEGRHISRVRVAAVRFTPIAPRLRPSPA